MDLENEQSSSTDSARTGNVFRAEDESSYPNPSNGTFNLRFAVEEPSDVRVQIRDARAATWCMKKPGELQRYL